MKHYFLFSRHDKELYLRASLRNESIFLWTILWEYEYRRMHTPSSYLSSIDIDSIRNYAAKDTVFICETLKEADYLKGLGVNDDKVFVFFSRRPNISMFKYVICKNWLQLNLVYVNKLRKFKRRFEFNILDFMYKYIEKKGCRFAVVGTSEYSDYFVKKIKANDIYIGRFKLEGEKGEGKPVQELLYEDEIENITIFLLHLNVVRKAENVLYELGFSYNQIFTLGDTRSNAESGAAPLDIYDIRLGYTRISDEVPGYVVFQNKEDGPLFTILCLGGSTSDPTTANVKSWSECLFEKLTAMKIHVKIWAGGISAYVVEQEMDKLIRDGMVIKPDLVLSYSGINNAQGTYNVEFHPMIRKYQNSLYSNFFKKGGKNNVQIGIQIKGITLGLEDFASRSEGWLNAERIMQGVSKEFGFAFHAFLQPYNQYGDYYTDEKDLEIIKKFYDEAKRLIASQSFIHDFTSIFEGEEDVFFDVCHTYEKGNRIIAKKMLPTVVDEIRKRRL